MGAGGRGWHAAEEGDDGAGEGATAVEEGGDAVGEGDALSEMEGEDDGGLEGAWAQN